MSQLALADKNVIKARQAFAFKLDISHVMFAIHSAMVQEYG